ncbi:MAG: hypothetical protein JSU04_04925 [Bdellovibrionales bacterium]|nr:hypothetical protein [Bdellovibrionales bacterium]
MFSKKHLCWLLSFVLVTTSCAPKVGEAPPETQQQKLGGTQCLSGLQPVIESFVAGTASDANVSAAWDCASNAIVKFKKYVYGRSADRFEATELADFLRTNFLEANAPAITPELRNEAMRIKQLFLGGSIDYITRTELDKIIDMLGDLKSITLHLNPYMKLIAQKWSVTSSANVQDDIRYFEKASDEIQSAARALANMIKENNQSYELDHFVIFLREFSNFAGQDWPVANQIERGMPVIKKVKKAISGGDPNSIGPTEWKSFVLLGARGYLQYLRYYYFIKSASETGSGIRLGYLARSLEDLLGAFQDLLDQKPVDASCGAAKVSCISKQEITDILMTFADVWSDFQVSEKLISEAMKIKKVIFGGTDTNITSRDFERGKNKVASLKTVVEKTLPYYQVYSTEWDRSNFDYNTAQNFFKEAANNLQNSAGDLGALFEDSYSIDNLVSLLTEVDRLYPSDDPKKHPALDVQKYIPLVKDIKNIVFSENDTLIKKAQWSDFLKFSARFYNSYLFHNYFVKPEQYGSPRFLDAFKKLSDQVLTVTKDVVLKKKNQIITAAEVNLIAARLVELDLIPKEITPQSIDQIVKVVLNRILWPAELRLKGSVPNGITPTSIDNVRAELQIWYETEAYLYSLTATPMKPTDLQAQVSKKLKDPKITTYLKTGLTEISMMIAGDVAQPVDKDGHLIITNTLKLTYNNQSVARLNLNRILGRVLIRAATTNAGRLQRYEGVEQPEAQALFDQVKPAVVAMGLLEEKNTTFIESRFREANIFTAHSNGDTYVNFPEATDIVGMILSGIAVNNLFRKDVEDTCLSPAGRAGEEIFVAEKCIRRVYIQQTATYLTATPEYVKFFKKLSPDDMDDFLMNILKAAGHVPNAQNTVKLTDADLAPHVIQYVEMTMSKYDADHDGVINLAEAKNAFPSFKGILKELTKDQKLIKEKDLLALFTYILHYGQPPGGVKDFLLKWLPWKSDQSKWTVAADRQDLAGILGYIADQVAKAKVQNKNAKASLITDEEAGSIRRDPGFREEP